MAKHSCVGALSQRCRLAGSHSVWKWLFFSSCPCCLASLRMETSNTSSPRCLGLERQILHCGLLQPHLRVCPGVQGGDTFYNEFSEQGDTGRQQQEMFCYVHKAFLPVLQEQHINETVNTWLLFFLPLAATRGWTGWVSWVSVASLVPFEEVCLCDTAALPHPQNSKYFFPWCSPFMPVCCSWA